MRRTKIKVGLVQRGDSVFVRRRWQIAPRTECWDFLERGTEEPCYKVGDSKIVSVAKKGTVGKHVSEREEHVLMFQISKGSKVLPVKGNSSVKC